MDHPEDWYADLARKLGRSGYVTLAEIRQEEARQARELASLAKWQRQAVGYSTEQEGHYYLARREPGRRTWMLETWPLSGQGPVHELHGIGTLAEAKSLALACPCFRCGLAGPLAFMVPVLPASPAKAADPRNRFRCRHIPPCEAARARLTGTDGGLVQVQLTGAGWPARTEMRI